ncbi:MAG: GNAT family N-acetyltransferase [Clostridiaceae bacterium]|nr:GNAT family N-acetyltransferase [Clostridiaceae bacterium]
MQFMTYAGTESFGGATLETLLENEEQNNLPISFIRNERGLDTSGWLLATVRDPAGSVVLVAACTPPHNIVLYETQNRPHDAAVRRLADELKALAFPVPGVLAEQSLARRFAAIYAGDANWQRHMSMQIMRLDTVNTLAKASGHARLLREDDLFFVPYWERAFGEECQTGFFDIPAHTERIRQRIAKNCHLIWEDRIPVSQAVHGRSTEHGAVINGVYTPPPYRNRGYASAVVAELARMLLDRGHRFCCLFADAQNPISCGIYHKIGFVDRCLYDELRFAPPAERSFGR